MEASTQARSAQRTAGGFVPLRARAPLALRRSACLRSRWHASECQACAQACPVGCLELTADGVALNAGCTGCGRCQAACPMGALAAEGFAAAQRPESGAAHRPLFVDCARFGATSGAGLQVACLGGLSAAALVDLCERAGDRRVVLLDHGACSACDSGGAQHPAQATVERVLPWLRHAGVPDALLPRIESHEAPQAGGEADSCDPLQSRGRARRGFLGALAQPARPRASAPAPAMPPRQVLLSALARLAERHGGGLAPALFHRVQVGSLCQGLRICAASCPTHALLRYRDETAGVAGIAFDPQACIGCGHCAAVCPRQALQVVPATDAGSGRRILTRFAQRECTECGARFAPSAGDADSRCERCRKSAELARAAFHSLFPTRNRLQPWGHSEET